MASKGNKQAKSKAAEVKEQDAVEQHQHQQKKPKQDKGAAAAPPAKTPSKSDAGAAGFKTPSVPAPTPKHREQETPSKTGKKDAPPAAAPAKAVKPAAPAAKQPEKKEAGEKKKTSEPPAKQDKKVEGKGSKRPAAEPIQSPPKKAKEQKENADHQDKDGKKKGEGRPGPVWWCETDVHILKRVQRQMGEKHADETFGKDLGWVDWEVVADDEMTPEEAKKRFAAMTGLISRRRTVQDILGAAHRAFESAKKANNVLSVADFKETVGSRRKKVEVDPERPRRPASSYLLWVETQRAAMVAKHPDVPYRELTKIMAEKWKTVSSKEKAKFDALAKQQLEEYQEKLKEYLETHPEARTTASLKLLSKDPDAPKKPEKSAFMLFANEQRARLTDLAFGDRQRHISEAWKKLSEEEHEEFQRKLEAKQEQYAQDRKAYLAGLPESERELFLARETSQRTRAPQKPTAFSVFCEEQRPILREENPELSEAELMQLLREKHMNLSAEEKKDNKAKTKVAELEYFKACLEFEKFRKDREQEKEQKKKRKRGAGAASKQANPQEEEEEHEEEEEQQQEEGEEDEEEEEEAAAEQEDHEAEPQEEDSQMRGKQEEAATAAITPGKHKHAFLDQNDNTLPPADQEELYSRYREWKKNGEDQGMSMQVKLGGKSCTVNFSTFAVTGHKVIKSLQRKRINH